MARAPLEWRPTPERTTFAFAPHRTWIITQEKAITGTAVSSWIRRPIEQTRLRFEEETRRGPRLLGYLQHVSVAEVVWLEPGDRHLSDLSPAFDDSLRPWPNPCGLTVDEPDRPIDLNHNGRPELAVRQWANLPDPVATHLILVEADSRGRPRVIPPAELVGTVRFDEGVITDVVFPKDEPGPLVEAEFLPLYDCRFLAQLGIRGRSECRSCCEVPVYLRADSKGVLQPVYDYETQRWLFERCREDIATARALSAGLPPTTAQQVALARAAAFYYLTGTGRSTRYQLEQGLGSAAASDYHYQLLLTRLDRYFLAPNPAG